MKNKNIFKNMFTEKKLFKLNGVIQKIYQIPGLKYMSDIFQESSGFIFILK